MAAPHRAGLTREVLQRARFVIFAKEAPTTLPEYDVDTDFCYCRIEKTPSPVGTVMSASVCPACVCAVPGPTRSRNCVCALFLADYFNDAMGQRSGMCPALLTTACRNAKADFPEDHLGKRETQRPMQAETKRERESERKRSPSPRRLRSRRGPHPQQQVNHVTFDITYHLRPNTVPVCLSHCTGPYDVPYKVSLHILPLPQDLPPHPPPWSPLPIFLAGARISSWDKAVPPPGGANEGEGIGRGCSHLPDSPRAMLHHTTTGYFQDDAAVMGSHPAPAVLDVIEPWQTPLTVTINHTRKTAIRVTSAGDGESDGVGELFVLGVFHPYDDMALGTATSTSFWTDSRTFHTARHAPCAVIFLVRMPMG